jgi:hypothetical protein
MPVKAALVTTDDDEAALTVGVRFWHNVLSYQLLPGM